VTDAAERQGAVWDSADEVERSLLGFLESRTGASWAPDEDLFASGAVSSLFAMELVLFLERTFGVSVSGENLTLDNFRTVHAMAALIRRLGGAAAGRQGSERDGEGP
jgi:methoxymalonate biosynthesis acyl carrier protein